MFTAHSIERIFTFCNCYGRVLKKDCEQSKVSVENLLNLQLASLVHFTSHFFFFSWRSRALAMLPKPLRLTGEKNKNASILPFFIFTWSLPVSSALVKIVSQSSSLFFNIFSIRRCGWNFLARAVYEIWCIEREKSFSLAAIISSFFEALEIWFWGFYDSSLLTTRLLLYLFIVFSENVFFGGN